MRRNTDKLLAYVDSVNVKPLIIGLSEIWISASEMDFYSVDGYNLFVNGNNLNRSGGVAIYAANTLNCKHFNIDYPSFNALGVIFSINSKLMCVLCLYRFGYLSFSMFLDDFTNLLRNLSHTNLLIMGDFNIDFLHTNPELDNFIVLLSNHGLDILISEPTRITNSSATCIDNVLYRLDERHFQKVTCTVLDLRVTDHCLLDVELSARFALSPLKKKKKHVLSFTDYSKLKNLLTFEEWGAVLSCKDASVAFDNFIDIFSNHLSSCTSQVTRSKSHKLNVWMSNYLLNLLRKRNKFCQLAKKHPTNSRLRNYSLKLCELVHQNIDLSKKRFYKNQFRLNGKSARKNWKTVNEIITGYPESNDIKEINSQLGYNVSDPATIANEFNEYFTSVGSNNISTVDLATTDKERLIMDSNNTVNSFYFSPITPCELYYVINSLKEKSSPGIDGITNSVIKPLACFLVDVLAFIFNLSVETGTFPLYLKKAVVIPLFKKGDKSCINNYRPISLLSVFSKIFEKIMKKRILGFLNVNNLLSGSQYGFRKKRTPKKHFYRFWIKLLSIWIMAKLSQLYILI